MKMNGIWWVYGRRITKVSVEYPCREVQIKLLVTRIYFVCLFVFLFFRGRDNYLEIFGTPACNNVAGELLFGQWFLIWP